MFVVWLMLLLQPGPTRPKIVEPPPLVQPADAKDDAPNFGIGPRQHFAKEERCLVNGQETSPVRVLEMLRQPTGAPELPDDKNKPWLVYVGKDKVDKVRAAPLLAPLAARFRVQSAAADEWYAKVTRKDGTPRFKAGATVFLADGTEVYHTEDLAALLDKLKNLAADFDLRKLPDLFRPTPPPDPGPLPLPDPSKVPWTVWVIAALVFYLLVTRKNK